MLELELQNDMLFQEKIEFNAKSTLADMLANADTEILKEKIKLIMKEIDAEK